MMLLDAVREGLARDAELSEARRLFHGRGGCFAGLDDVNVDWFEPLVLITLHGERPSAWLDGLAKGLGELLGERLRCVLVQRRHLPQAPMEVQLGTPPNAPRAVESGLTYRLRFGRAQNIGFFVDMRHGRDLVRGLAAGRKVLNLFAYTCAFSMVALQGGASHVTNVDMSGPSLAVGRDNHRDNGLDMRAVSFLAHDVFKSFAKLRRLGPFDLIILDPPSVQGRSFGANRDWPKLIQRLPTLASRGADVVACLNSPHLGSTFMTERFAEHFPQAELEALHPPGPDFLEADPEAGLKLFHYRL